MTKHTQKILKAYRERWGLKDNQWDYLSKAIEESEKRGYLEGFKAGQENMSEDSLSLQEDTKKNIGQLRQWLNEDRITDPKKMVTNEEIETWISPQDTSFDTGRHHEYVSKDSGGDEANSGSATCVDCLKDFDNCKCKGYL